MAASPLRSPFLWDMAPRHWVTGSRRFETAWWGNLQGYKILHYYYYILIISIEMKQYAGIYLLQNHSTHFECLSHPSPGVHQTVTAASGTGHSVRATTFLQRGLIRTCRVILQ